MADSMSNHSPITKFWPIGISLFIGSVALGGALAIQGRQEKQLDLMDKRIDKVEELRQGDRDLLVKFGAELVAARDEIRHLRTEISAFRAELRKP